MSDFGVVAGASILVDPAAPGITIPTNFVGFSYETSYLTLNKIKPSNVALLNFFKMFNGNLSLRMGGNTSDTQIPVNSAIDDCANFVAAAGCSLIYGLPGKIIAPSASDADQAAVDAAIALRVANILGTTNVMYQIGNEPNFYGISYATYASRWATIQTAVTAAVAGAKYCGSDDGTGGLSRPTFLPQFAADKGSLCTQFSFHKYCAGLSGQNNPAVTIPLMLQNDSAQVDLDNFSDQPMLAAHSVRITESGSIGGAANALDAACLGASLWNIATMIYAAINGVAGINFHGNEFSTAGYNPLSDQNDGTWNGGQTPWVQNTDVYDGNGTYRAQASFYAMLLFSQLAGGQIIPNRSVGLTRGQVLGVKGADGKTRVLVSNRSLDLGMSVAISSSATFTRAKATILTAPDFKSRNMTYGGQVASPTGVLNPVPTSLPIAAGVATLVLPAASSAVVELS